MDVRRSLIAFIIPRYLPPSLRSLMRLRASGVLSSYRLSSAPAMGISGVSADDGISSDVSFPILFTFSESALDPFLSLDSSTIDHTLDTGTWKLEKTCPHIFKTSIMVCPKYKIYT